jgi:hypothetical protein
MKAVGGLRSQYGVSGRMSRLLTVQQAIAIIDAGEGARAARSISLPMRRSVL